MALAGAGNVTGGSNPAGIGTSLNYAGNLVYAYSGAKNGTASYVSYLNFSTGNELILAKVNFNGAPSPDDPSTGGESICRITLDGQVVSYMKTSTNSPDSTGSVQQNTLVIPPFTKVEIDVRTLANAAFQGTVVFTGVIQ